MRLAPLLRVSFDERTDGAIPALPLILAGFLVLSCSWVSLRLPLRLLDPVLWVALPCLIFAGLWIRDQRVRRAELLLGLAASLTAWTVLADVSGHILPPVCSYHPDAWSYGGLADYLLHYPRGHSLAGLPLIDQYGGCLQNTRFGTPSVLAFLECAPGSFGNPLCAQLEFCFLCLATHFVASFYFVRGLLVWPLAGAAAILSTALGWLADAIIIGNFDNLLFVALLPVWLGIAVRFLNGGISTRRFVAAGALTVAALFDVYPEGFTLVCFLTLPLICALLVRAWQNRAQRYALGALFLLSLILVLPYLPIFAGFLRGQIAAGTAPPGVVLRPGTGNFTGLLGRRFLPAVFALGEEYPHASFRPFDLMLAGLLCLLICRGAWMLGKANRWFLWVAPCIVVLGAWQWIWARYDYGVYKVVLCASWWIYPATIAGLMPPMGGLRSRSRTKMLAGGSFLAFGVAIAFAKVEGRKARWREHYAMKPLRELTGIDEVIGQAPVLLDVDNDFEYLWAITFLRSHPLASSRLRSYMTLPQFGPFDCPAPDRCRYILVSGPRSTALWHNQQFSLLLNPNAVIRNGEEPSGTAKSQATAFSP